MALVGQMGRERPAAAADSTSVARVDNAAGSSPIVLICEHASNCVPSRYGNLGLGPIELDSHIAWDPGALGVAQKLSRLLDAPLVSALVSRLVIDLNRDPSAPDSIVPLSDRTAVPGNVGLSAAERALRINDFYHDFHRVADVLIDERVASGHTRAVVSIHSFTPSYQGVLRPWHVGLIFARDERLARHVEEGLVCDPDLVVGMNQPYSPLDRVFHTLERHAERRGLAPLMIEIRNDLIRRADEQTEWAERLAPLLKEVVERV